MSLGFVGSADQPETSLYYGLEQECPFRDYPRQRSKLIFRNEEYFLKDLKYDYANKNVCMIGRNGKGVRIRHVPIGQVPPGTVLPWKLQKQKTGFTKRDYDIQSRYAPTMATIKPPTRFVQAATLTIPLACTNDSMNPVNVPAASISKQ